VNSFCHEEASSFDGTTESDLRAYASSQLTSGLAHF